MLPEQIALAQQLTHRLIAPKTPPRKIADGNTAKGNGTGFFITEDGYLLTNHHVVKDAKRVEIVVGKDKKIKAKVIRLDPLNDLAVLKVDGNFSHLPVKSSRGVGLGTDVLTVGFPRVNLQGFEPKLTKGSISGLAGIQDDPRNFQISVPIQPGNSGGALVDDYGNVIGVVVAGLDQVKVLQATGTLPQDVNYAIKGTYVNALLESLPDVVRRLKEPHPKGKKRDFSVIAKEAQAATVMVLVY
jgi:S1-C subfamily serine protease